MQCQNGTDIAAAVAAAAAADTVLVSVGIDAVTFEKATARALFMYSRALSRADNTHTHTYPLYFHMIGTSSLTLCLMLHSKCQTPTHSRGQDSRFQTVSTNTAQGVSFHQGQKRNTIGGVMETQENTDFRALTAYIGLPGRQLELVRRVAAAAKAPIVVVILRVASGAGFHGVGV